MLPASPKVAALVSLGELESLIDSLSYFCSIFTAASRD